MKPSVEPTTRKMRLSKVAVIVVAAVLILIVGIAIMSALSKTQSVVMSSGEQKRVEEGMASYLADRYGMQFTVRDAQIRKDIPSTGKIEVMTATVSPNAIPDFSYTAMVYLHGSATDPIDDRLAQATYREDFIGEYWKFGFKETICPAIRSARGTLNVTVCDVTSYSLKIDYNAALKKHRGNIASFAQLSKEDKALLNFGVTIESADEKSHDNLLRHVEFIQQSIRIIRSTNATSTLVYYAEATGKTVRLGYSGTTNPSTPGGKIPVLNLMYEQDTAVEKQVVDTHNSRRYYNPSAKTFNLSRASEDFSR